MSISNAPQRHLLSSLIGIAPIPCLPSMCPCMIFCVNGSRTMRLSASALPLRPTLPTLVVPCATFDPSKAASILCASDMLGSCCERSRADLPQDLPCQGYLKRDVVILCRTRMFRVFSSFHFTSHDRLAERFCFHQEIAVSDKGLFGNLVVAPCTLVIGLFSRR